MLNAQALVDRTRKVTTFDIIQEPKIGANPLENEFLVFLKPEMFLATEQDSVLRVNLVLEKLAQFGVSVDGMIAVNGQVIEEKQMMATHYGLINTLSRTASKLVTNEDRAKMTELLGEDCAQIEVLGGHEAIQKFPSFSPKSLDEFWFTRKSLRVRSGFYFQKYEIEGGSYLLVNAFHPYQLAYFTDRSHHVLLLVCHSKTEWKTLRWNMIGNTFPEKAEMGSIRRTLCEKSQELGFANKVDISCNGVHFSVGPFEGVKELNNFVGKILGRDLVFETSFAKMMIEKGLSKELVEKSITNPMIMIDGHEKELFGPTEDMNPEQALKIYMDGVK